MLQEWITTFEASGVGKFTMISFYQIALPFIWGMILGVFFYSGQKFMIQKALTSSNQQFVLSLSFVVRITVVLWGFYLLADGGWQRLLVCLISFLWMKNFSAREVRNA